MKMIDDENQMDLLNLNFGYDASEVSEGEIADYEEKTIEDVVLEGYFSEFNPPKIENFEDATLEEKMDVAIQAMLALLRLNKTLIVCCSFGKDSSVCLALALMALKIAKELGIEHPTAWVLHSDTGIENPIITQYAHGEIEKVRHYIKSEDLNMGVFVATPNLTNNYLVQLLGGRITASLPGMDAKCQSMLKAIPLDSAKKSIKKIYAESIGVSSRSIDDSQFVSIIGNRFDESNARAQKMRERGESATVPTLVEKNGAKNWVLSAIADWETMDVFEMIGAVTNNRISTYSDFQDLARVYRESQGECMVNLYVSGQGEKKTACSSRFGCWTCARVQDDKSMENLLAHEEYSWLKGLNTIRNYIVAQHFNPTKRSWVPRIIDPKTGTVKISPNTYSPEFCLELLRYVITEDVMEYKRSHGCPRFQHLPLESVIAIDLLNARYGYLTPHRALIEFYEIWDEGERYFPPSDFENYPRNSFPKPIVVPFSDQFYEDIYSGFRDPMSALNGDELYVIDKNGRRFFNANTSSTFSVDTEGAWLFYDMNMEDIAKEKDSNAAPSSALFTYLRYGTVSVAKGAHSEWDRMLRCSNQIARHGIVQDELSDPVKVIKKVVSNLILSDEKIDAINDQLQADNFSKYYQGHYGRQPEFMPKRSMSPDEVANLNVAQEKVSSPYDLADEVKVSAKPSNLIDIIQIETTPSFENEYQAQLVFLEKSRDVVNKVSRKKKAADEEQLSLF